MHMTVYCNTSFAGIAGISQVADYILVYHCVEYDEKC